MKLKAGDVEKLQAILRFIGNRSATPTIEVAQQVGVSGDEIDRLRAILVGHDAIDNKYPSMVTRNHNTRNYHDAGYFGQVYEQQMEENARQNEEDKARRIAIRNGRWALPLSIVSIVGTLVTLVLSVLGII